MLCDVTILITTNHEVVKSYLTKHSPILEIEMGRVIVQDLKTPVRSQYFDIVCY